jgi:pimeloyl-ACP methyl ester carboxylesterase
MIKALLLFSIILTIWATTRCRWGPSVCSFSFAADLARGNFAYNARAQAFVFDSYEEIGMATRWGHIWLISMTLLVSQFACLTPVQYAAAAEPASLTTRDGVLLKISYFPGNARKGSPQGKQTTPVVFLHDHKGSRAVFAGLIQKLQATAKGEGEQPNFAAVTVDLRGHGESTKLANNAQVELNAAKLNKEDLIAMASYDLDAVRNFLVLKNDEGELNLNKLCFVGSGMGASVAANWALTDWSYPPLAIGKQGQDVKAIVMISPRWTYNGLLMQGPMQFRALKERLAWMIVYGDKDPKFQADAVRINKQLERFHPATDDKGAKRTSGLTVVKLNTRLQGDSLLTQVGLSADDKIVEFLTKNVAETQQEWISRRNRLP